MGQGLPVFLAEVARCRVQSGAVFFTWDGFEIALPINTYLANVAAANRALAEWQERGAEVVQLARH